MINKIIIHCILFLVTSLFSSTLFAGARAPDSGHGQLFINIYFYQAQEGFGKNRNKYTFLNSKRFKKYELNPFVIYSLSTKWSIQYNGFFNQLISDEFNSNKNSTGFGDQEFGIRYKVFENSEGGLLALQELISIPFYSNSRDPMPGNHQIDLELRLLYDQYLPLFNLDSFFSGEVAYRLRTKAPADQIRSALTGGYHFLSKYLHLIQFEAIYSLKNGDQETSSSNPNLTSDFDLYKLGTSLVYDFYKQNRLQVGINFDVAGRNTSKGRTLLISWWRDF